ncbi:hypothetical protein THH46_14180 [Pseudomonas sp. NA13]
MLVHHGSEDHQQIDVSTTQVISVHHSHRLRRQAIESGVNKIIACALHQGHGDEVLKA